MIEPFELNIAQADLDELARRLSTARWPDKEPVEDWSQGVPSAFMRSLTNHWLGNYDWRRCEAMLNGMGQHRALIDGLGIHFLHIRSPEPQAMPLLMTHGWPGSVIEFHKVVGPLTDPVAHGGKAEDAFHLVLPSLPGYGFSDRPAETGWGVDRIATAWTELMRLLGYRGFVAQGGDWGAAVTTAIGRQAPPECLGIHLNMPIAFPTPEERLAMTQDETQAVTKLEYYLDRETGYAKEQQTKPQTLAYLLADSPLGQAAWIVEKFRTWSDCGGDPLSVFTMDELIDNIALYWLTNTGGSSGRLYWESLESAFDANDPIGIWAGATIFPEEIFRPSRRWVERRYTNLGYWSVADRGGHFAAFEQPEIFVDELRRCFAALRT